MMDFQIVDRPSIFPGACVLCHSQTGPQCDTFCESRAGRAYVCSQCAGHIGKAFGFALDSDYKASQEREAAHRAEAERLQGELETAHRHAAETWERCDRQDQELVVLRSERASMESTLVLQGRELTAARNGGFRSAQEVREQASAAVAAAAVEKPLGRRHRRTPVNEGAKR